MSNRISKIRVKGVDYEVRSKRGSVTKTINSLFSIPVDVESIVANISNSTSFSLASNMNKGDHIDLLCVPSSDFQQEISGDNIKTSFDGKISVKNGQPFKLYINCYDTNKIFIDASNVEIIPFTHTVTFKVTPSDATVNYSIGSQTYDQTTTSNGTVSNVPHGSTIYYKISKTGYGTITKSQVVNDNVTITENMVINKYTVTFKVTPSDATVNYSIGSQTYDQTTTSNGTVSNVPHGSTIYYKISKTGYGTITKSQVVNDNVTITENMVINKYNVTFKVTPSDATVNYSIGSQTYDQTTTSNGTVSNVPHGSTIYYKISKTGYGTITKSQVVNDNVTITENMVINKYNVTFKVTPSDATVNYSIGSQTYDQTTTGTGTVSNVPHGSTIYYKISKDGYNTITKSQTVNNNVTVTENMTIAYYILVSTSSSGSATITKYTNREGTETEQITIPANSTKYKVDGLMYGFKNNNGMYITELDVTNLNTSNVTIMRDMFYMCNLLTSLDVSNFDTSNMTDMRSMFYMCNLLTSLDVSNFDTSKVTNMEYMFGSCSSLTSLNLSNFDTSNVTRVWGMFQGCIALTSLDLSNFDISKVVAMKDMFKSCDSLNHIKCKQAFKDWCWANQDFMSLPTAMRSGGSGRWEIVG